MSGKIHATIAFSYPPLEGQGRLAWSEAKCVTGWGDSLSSSVVFRWFDLSFARRRIDP
jgi:hypothetical protein